MTTTMHEPLFEPRTRVVVEPGAVGDTGRTAGVRRRSVRPVPVACPGSSAPSVHGGALTPRGRLVLALVWLLLIGAALLAFARPWNGAEPTVATITVQVEAGDTLWELAGEVAPAADRRDTVAAIVKLNGLSSAGDIRAGDALLVPADR